MILGIISFIFIIYELSFGPDGDTVLSFEFAHLFIFLFAIFYTLVVLVTMYMSSRMSFRWKQMEKMDLVHYLSLKDKYNQLNTTVNKRTDKIWRTLWWFPNFSKLVNYTYMHEVMSFHDIRFQFIYYRNLPEDFRFSSFLRKIKSTTFIDLVESHWSLYVIFLVIVLLDILRRTVFGRDPESSAVERSFIALFATVRHVSKVVRADEDSTSSKPKGQTGVEYGNDTDAILIICFSVLLSVIVQVLAMKIKNIFWKITQHPRTYYEGVQAEAVEEELVKAAQERELLRERRRSRSVSLSREKQNKSMDGNDTGNEADIDDGTQKYEKQRKLEQRYQQQITTEETENFDDDMNDVDPVNELLDPMHAQPLQSPLVKNPSSQNLAGMDQGSEMDVSVDNSFGMRHSMERARTDLVASSSGANAQRSLTDLQPSALTSHRESGLQHDAAGHEEPIHFFDHDEHSHDKAVVRHSLDIPRRNKSSLALGAMGSASTAHGAPSSGTEIQPTSASSTTSAILARAALEAAKKRTVSEVPAASSGQPAAVAVQSDNESVSSAPVPPKVGSPRMLSHISSRRGSLDNSYAGSVRGSLDAPRGRLRPSAAKNGQAPAPSKLSIELAVVMARDELKTQLEKPTAYHFDTENESDRDRRKDRKIMSRRSLSPGDNARAANAAGISHHRSSTERVRFSVDHPPKDKSASDEKDVRIDIDEIEKETTAIKALTKTEMANMNNPTIMKYFEEHRDIENLEPSHYPKFIKKLIPRLGRVASRVEKLFWFGSHRFFMWCVEFVLFFSTVLLAAATAGISLILVENKKEPKYAIAINALHIISVISAGLALIFVLYRIAIIMQRYIFILHNASLIPEVVALEAIQNVSGKRVVRDDYSDDLSGSETEREDDEAARERRKRLGRFFRSEAESGNVTGIEATKTDKQSTGSNGINTIIRQSIDLTTRRRSKRRAANQRRRVRLWKSNRAASGTDIRAQDEDVVTVSTVDDRKSRDTRRSTEVPAQADAAAPAADEIEARQ